MNDYESKPLRPELSYYKSTMRCSKDDRPLSDPSSNPCIDASFGFCCSSSGSIVCASLAVPSVGRKE